MSILIDIEASFPQPIPCTTVVHRSIEDEMISARPDTESGLLIDCDFFCQAIMPRTKAHVLDPFFPSLDPCPFMSSEHPSGSLSM